MELTFVHFLIVCPLVCLAGFVDAIGGGGGLISLPAYLLAGLPAHFAIATNKMSSSMGTTMATVKYGRSGFIPWKTALICVPFALGGSALGAKLALLIADRYFKIILLAILPLTAWYVMRKKTMAADRPPLPFPKTAALAAGTALVIGVYDGFYGPGTGMFLILLLTALVHLTLRNANGLAKVINLSTNIAALTVYLINGKVLLPLGLTAGLFGILGNWLGARCFERVGIRAVKPVMLALLAICFVKVAGELLGWL